MSNIIDFGGAAKLVFSKAGEARKTPVSQRGDRYSRPGYLYDSNSDYPSEVEQDKFVQVWGFPDLLDYVKDTSLHAYTVLGLKTAGYLGCGVHSRVYRVGESQKVIKFTRNTREAWSNYLLSQNPQINLVHVHGVYWIEEARIWAIQAEYLDVGDCNMGDKWHGIIEKDTNAAGFWMKNVDELIRQNGLSMDGVTKCYDFGFASFHMEPRIKLVPRI